MKEMSRMEELAREGAMKGLSLEDITGSLGDIIGLLHDHIEGTDHTAPAAITAAIMMTRCALNFFYELDNAIERKIGRLTFDLPQCIEYFYFARRNDRLPAIFDVHLEPNEDFNKVCQELPIQDKEKVQGVKDQIGGALDHLEPEIRQKVLLEVLGANHNAVHQGSAEIRGGN